MPASGVFARCKHIPRALVNQRLRTAYPLFLCLQGKGHHLRFAKKKNIKTRPGELIHLDIWGPCSIQSLGGQRFYVCLTDDASRFSWVFLLKDKSEILAKYLVVEKFLLTQF